MKRICLYCSNEYDITAPQQKYCSKKCQEQSRKTRENYKSKLNGLGKGGFNKGKELVPRKICIVCGNKYYVPPSGEKRGQGKYCSRKCFQKMRFNLSKSFTEKNKRGKGGKRADLNNMYFRSRWEANYARYLNFLIKQGYIEKWEYEADTFEFTGIKRGTMFYTPDFKVHNRDGSIEYHEVKGWMDDRSKTRHKRMAKYYPHVKIIIKDSKWFNENGKKLSSLIPNWEKKNS